MSIFVYTQYSTSRIEPVSWRISISVQWDLNSVNRPAGKVAQYGVFARLGWRRRISGNGRCAIPGLSAFVCTSMRLSATSYRRFPHWYRLVCITTNWCVTAFNVPSTLNRWRPAAAGTKRRVSDHRRPRKGPNTKWVASHCCSNPHSKHSGATNAPQRHIVGNVF